MVFTERKRLFHSRFHYSSAAWFLALDIPLSSHFQWVASLSHGLPDWTLALSLVRRAILSLVCTLISSLVRIYGQQLGCCGYTKR